MEIDEQLYVATRDEWREWLERNHDKSEGIWLIYYKKGSGKPRIPYDDAVEEALCFGWIDSTAKSIDEEKYAQRFTPRRPGSGWSELNIRRMEKLIKEGRVTGAGLAKFRDPAARRSAIRDMDNVTPPGFTEALEKRSEALAYFNKLPPSQVKLFYRWINDAKREETKQKRIAESVELLAQGRKLSDKWFNRT
ncbi:YdeI/OmpD-associated family protein [Methanocella sp. MCL-LM]|uniref:YdeI/OmpD-associated family protein n=1 Tax=Methanocella sp. MCL-LM TaxID=3412035 RepID=UPI003C76521D